MLEQESQIPGEGRWTAGYVTQALGPQIHEEFQGARSHARTRGGSP